MPPLYNTYGAWVLRSKCYKDKPKTELPKLIWSKLDWSETLSFITILLSPKKNHDRNLVISRSLSSNPLNSYFRLINMEIHPRSHLVISFNLESHLAIPLPITNTKECVYGLIMMGDLPEWKRERVVSFFGWPTQIKKKMENGLIVMGDLPKEKGRVVSFFGWPTQGKEWPHSYGWPTQVKKMENGLIVWVTYPEK